MPAIRVGLRVDVSAGIEQQPRDVDDVRRRSLAKVFDAVRGDVVKKCRSMLTARSLPDQLRRLIEKAAKCRDVAEDDRIRGLLEFRIGRACSLQLRDMLSKLRPARKSVRTSDQKLRIGKLADLCGSDVPFDALDLIGRKLRRPFAQRRGIVAGLDEILRQFLVVAEVRMGWKRKSV